MLKNKRLLCTYALTFILISVSIFLLLGTMIPSLNESLNTYDRITSVYSDSKIDFIIPSPTKAQLDEMLEMDHINSIFACYSIYSSISIKDVEKRAYVLLIEDTSSLESTMFKSSRIKASTGNINSNSLLIDEVYANQNKLNLGDQVTWNITKDESVTMTIDAIYYKNEMDDARVAVLNSGAQKKIIDRLSANYPLSISSAYIDSNNCEQTKDMLKSYKPLGLLKTADDFEIYSDYEAYLESFYQTDYYPQIILGENFEIENAGTADMYKEEANKTVLWIAILSFTLPLIASAIITFALGLSKCAIQQIQDGLSKNRVYTGVIAGGLTVACVSALCGAVADFIYSAKGINVILPSTLFPLLAVTITLLAHLLLINKATKVQKK